MLYNLISKLVGVGVINELNKTSAFKIILSSECNKLQQLLTKLTYYEVTSYKHKVLFAFSLIQLLTCNCKFITLSN